MEEVEKPEDAAVVAQLQQAPIIAGRRSGSRRGGPAPPAETVAEPTLASGAKYASTHGQFIAADRIVGTAVFGRGLTLRFVAKRAL